MSLFKDRSRAYCVRSSVHLAMASTVEAQTAEEAKRLSKTESCDRNRYLQMPASRILTVNRNMNQFQRLMRGHSAANMRHTYMLVWRSILTVTFICGGYATPDYFQVHIFIRVQFVVQFRVPVLVEARAGFRGGGGGGGGGQPGRLPRAHCF